MKKIIFTCWFVWSAFSNYAQFDQPLLVGHFADSMGWIIAVENYVGNDNLEVFTSKGLVVIDPDSITEAIEIDYCPLPSNAYPPYHLNNDNYADYYCLQFSYQFSTQDSVFADIDFHLGCDSLDCLFDPLTQRLFISESDSYSTGQYHDFYDLDADGDEDLVVTLDFNSNPDYYTMIIFENDNLQFNKVAEVPICANCGKQFRQMVYEDMDADGLIDIMPYSSQDYSMSYIKQTSSMQFEMYDPVFLSPVMNSELYNSIYQISPVIKDMDNDGLPEILYYEYVGTWLSPVAIFQNLGNFEFSLYYSEDQFTEIGQTIYNEDFDNDGDMDRLIRYNSISEMPLYYYRMEEDGNSTIFYIDNHVYSFAWSDYDLDGDLDPFYTKGNDLYLMLNTGVEMTPDIAYVNTIAFADLNSNYIKDANEYQISAYTFFDDEIMTYSAGSGYFAFTPDTYSIHTLAPDSNWLDYNSVAVFFPMDTTVLYLPVQPVVTVTSLSTELCITQKPCGSWSPSSLWVTNNGTTTLDSLTVELELDSLFGFVGSAITQDSIVGNNIFWHIDSLRPLETKIIHLTLELPAVEFMGQQSTNIVHVGENDGTYSIMSNYLYDINCAYDPNDITEQNGHTDAGYILEGDKLDYIIRFQNTGSAVAEDVRIVNQLPSNTNASTIELISWSHPFVLQVDEAGKATFSFDNINLPDSASDELNSHGFVRFKINSLDSLPSGELIQSTAEIFFDLNPPIITNTEVNTIYSCADLEQATASATEVCSGDEISFSNNAIWIEDLTWTFNGQAAGEGNYTHTLNESGTMEMHASNSLCEYTQSWSLTANEITASFSSSGNMLTATPAISYQWYLNGVEISGATSQNYEITETGIYTVIAADNNGCSDLSDPLQVTFIGIGEISADLITLFPNPTSDFITITIPDNLIGSSMVLIDMLGNEVMNNGKITSNKIMLDCSTLATGIYELRIGNLNKVVVRK